MSKFLKFIIHLVILATILDVAALAAPPFFGITTAVIDGSEAETNLDMGSVTYAKATAVDELETGDVILVQDSSSVYKYKINSIDTSSGVYNVYDQENIDAGETAITLSGSSPRVIVTVPYIAYLIIATQSTEGLIVIGLVILFLIILFILSELWRKDGDIQENPEGEPAASREISSREERKQKEQELKKQARENAGGSGRQARRDYKAARKQLKEETAERKRQEKRRKKEERKRARTGGFVEDYDPIETRMSDEPMMRQEETATDEANRFLRQEIVAATAQEAEESAADAAVMQAEADMAEFAASEAADVLEEELQSPEESGQVVYQKMAIPIYTEEELLEKAKAAGESPEVIRDQQLGLTFLDYSDIILSDDVAE